MKRIFISLVTLGMVFSFQHMHSQDLGDILGQVTNTNTKAVYEDVYSFDIFVQLEISDPADETMVYNGYLSKDGSQIAVVFDAAGDQTTVILDNKNNAVLMLSESDGEKVGMAMAVDPEALAALSDEIKDATDFDTEKQLKTGKTKDILGYTCEEYVIREDDTAIQMWVSPDLGKEIAQDLIAYQQIFGGAFTHATGVDGMVLEYHFTDESSGENRSMKVTKLEQKARKKVVTSEYAIMSMGQ